MKKITYRYINGSGNHDREDFVVNLSEIQSVQPCYNRKSSKIFLKGSAEPMSVSVPLDELIELLGFNE